MKVGDYVEIKFGVSDSQMPLPRRDGLIVELIGQNNRNGDPDQALVMFSNGSFLKFHISQIKTINTSL